MPVDTAPEAGSSQKGVRQPDAENRPDQSVRARSREATVPRGEVPQDGGDEERENHRESVTRSNVHHEIHGQQVDDAERHRGAAHVDP